MKRIITMLLVLTALLAGCGSKGPEPTTRLTTVPKEAPIIEPTTEPTTQPTTEPTTEPAPVYYNPLNGQLLDAPFDKRIYAVTINNLKEAMPHIGIQDADIFMEMYVNGSIIRCLALYTDPSAVPAIGSVRSTRIMFNQIAQAYDLVVAHAGGSDYVLDDVKARGLDNFSVDVANEEYYAFRDKQRAKKYTWDACLFANGTGLEAYAEEKGIDIQSDPEKDYLLRFTEDGTPADGEPADAIHLTLTYKSSRATSKKDTDLIYDPSTGRYVFNQYGKEMVDGVTGEPESFRNVIIMLADITTVDHGYQKADFQAGGEGYFACGGRIIPIRWISDSEDSPFRFTTLDGQELQLGVGNTYLAITQNGSPVTYEQLNFPEETQETAEISEEAPGQEATQYTEDTILADEDYL